MKEKWKSVGDGYSYEVSNTGKIRNSKTNHEKALKPSKDGYLKVDLYKDGIATTKRVHRLVAEAFVSNPNSKPQVNHKDGNKRNNCCDNLEWVTNKENSAHAWNTGLARPSYGMLGKKNPNGGRKGKPIEIVETGEEFESTIECAKKIGGNFRHINDCLKGRQHTHKGYHYKYV